MKKYCARTVTRIMKTTVLKITFLALTIGLVGGVHGSENILATAPEFSLSELQGAFPYKKIEFAIGKLDKAFYTTTPTSKGDGLVVGQYPDSESIIALAKEVAAGQHSAYDSVLISHKDRLVFESYYGYGRSNLPHFQASATKTYTAMAIGRAIALGYLSMADLHKPILSFLPDVNTENLVEGAEKVTLHHTMSMRSGLRIEEQTLDALADAAEQPKGQQLAQFYFSQSEPVTEQKQIYQYQPVDPRLTMLVLDAVVPDSAKNFIKTELLDKLGIKQYAWQDNPSGVPEGAHSTSMMSRDMLKWASVITNQGQWQGKPFISKQFLQQATSSVATPTDDTWDYTGFRYGYHFWGKTLKVGELTFDSQFAWGGGTQMVIAVPELELSMVVTASARSAGFEVLELLETRVLPSFVK